jgi:endonuclease YncB( thermonuclease family)
MKLLVALLLSLSTLISEEISGTVVSVADGDTITILDSSKKQIKVRLNQIDAPEKGMAFGQKSKQSLSDLVGGKSVVIKIYGTDKYKRTLGIVFIDDLNVNLEQVRRGMAWVYTQYATDKEYFEAEKGARQEKTGLWGDPNPVEPWIWRKSGSKTQESPKIEAATTGECGAKRTCKAMASCEEARHYLNVCGVKSLDGDGDGVPCEKLCK